MRTLPARADRVFPQKIGLRWNSSRARWCINGTSHQSVTGQWHRRELARWGNETARREHRLDEVPGPRLTRITLPAYDVPVGQHPVNADAAALAIAQLRKRLRRARWIPWQRRKRPQMQTQIDELVRQRRSQRADDAERGRRL